MERQVTRRELLTGGAIGGATLGGIALPAQAQIDAPEQRQINDTLKSIVSELQKPTHSLFPADMGPVTRLREHMIEFMRGTNKWPDFIDVGYGIWFAMYDWHVRFTMQPNVTRLPDNRYGLTFMFTTLVLRTEQPSGYMSLPYDKER